MHREGQALQPPQPTPHNIMSNTTTHRAENTTTCEHSRAAGLKTIGWFANKYNSAAGWTINELSAYDKDWIESQGFSTANVYRTVNCASGTESITRFNFETGTYAFMDSGHLTETDKIKFDRAVRYNRAFLDTL